MTKKESALELASIGWYIFPIWGTVLLEGRTECLCSGHSEDTRKSIGKHPMFNGGHNKATVDQAQIEMWWNKHPNANVGVACGQLSGFCVLDIDPDNGGNETLNKYPEPPTTVEAISGSGGSHYFYKYKKGLPTGAGSLGNGIDIKSDGGYIIVSPSTHKSGGVYEWITDQSPLEMNLAEPPLWMFKKVEKKNLELMKNIGKGKRNSDLTSFAGKLRSTGLGLQEIMASLLEINRRRCKPPLPDDDVITIAHSTERYRVSDVKEKKKGRLGKIVEMLENDTNINDCFRYNLFTKDLEYGKVPTFSIIERNSMSLTDDDFVEIKFYLSSIHSTDVTKETLVEAVITMAHKNEYHPIRNYINNLKWDGINKLDKWLIDYMGAEDSVYTRAVGRKVLVAAISRIFNPGCKFDFMMILEGEQGIGKSQAVEALAGDWFLDTDFKEKTKDTIDKMRGAWIVEFAELAGFRRSDVENLKAFLSRRRDRERLAYKRLTEDFPRQCVFVGTINPEGDNTYFFDETGNRRFWAIECSKADYKGLAAVRDQLLAEAMFFYNKHEKLYLDDPEAAAIALKKQSDRQAKDPWLFIIKDYVHPKQTVTGKELLTTALNIPSERQNKISLMKVGGIMKQLKWEKKRESSGKREYFYERNSEVEWDE